MTFRVSANQVTDTEKKWKVRLWPFGPSVAPVFVEEPTLRGTVQRVLRSKNKKGGKIKSLSYRRKSKTWDVRGGDARTQNQLRVEVSKAMAQFIRHNHKGQIWFEQQQIVEEIKEIGHSKSLDEETLLIMTRIVKNAHQETTKSGLFFR